MKESPYVTRAEFREHMGRDWKLAHGIWSNSKGLQSATNHRARAYASADITGLVNGAWTDIVLNTENYDPGSNFNTTTGKFTVPIAGVYLAAGMARFVQTAAGEKYYLGIECDGTIISQDVMEAAAANDIFSCGVHDMFEFAAGKDVVLQYFTSDSSGTPDIQGGSAKCFMAIHLLSTL